MTESRVFFFSPSSVQTVFPISRFMWSASAAFRINAMKQQQQKNRNVGDVFFAGTRCRHRMSKIIFLIRKIKRRLLCVRVTWMQWSKMWCDTFNTPLHDGFQVRATTLPSHISLVNRLQLNMQGTKIWKSSLREINRRTNKRTKKKTREEKQVYLCE